MATWVTALLVVGQTVSGAAQEIERGPRRRASRHEIEGLMEAYIISKLQEALDLTDEQFAKMVVAQKRLQGHRRDRRTSRQETLQQLRRAVRNPNSSDEEIAGLMKELEENEDAFLVQQRADYQAIDAILSLRQRARYRLLELEIERRLQELVREIRGRRPERQRPPPQP
ncbi:MAG: hypothetical protein ACE5JI_11800 [Acidobacteriota bacterium]